MKEANISRREKSRLMRVL